MPGKIKDRFLSTITGFSTPFFGIQWEPKPNTSEVIRKLLEFLSDKRVLHTSDAEGIEAMSGGHRLHPEWVMASIKEIRVKLTATCEATVFDEETHKLLEGMREAARDIMETVPENRITRSGRIKSKDVATLRIMFGVCIGRLSEMYKIRINEDLQKLVRTARDQASR